MYLRYAHCGEGNCIANYVKLPVPKSTWLWTFFTKNLPPDDEHRRTDFVFTYTVSIYFAVKRIVNIREVCLKLISDLTLINSLWLYLSHNYSSSSVSLFIFVIQITFLVKTVFENGATVYDFVNSCTYNIFTIFVDNMSILWLCWNIVAVFYNNKKHRFTLWSFTTVNICTYYNLLHCNGYSGMNL